MLCPAYFTKTPMCRFRVRRETGPASNPLSYLVHVFQPTTFFVKEGHETT